MHIFSLIDLTGPMLMQHPRGEELPGELLRIELSRDSSQEKWQPMIGLRNLRLTHPGSLCTGTLPRWTLSLCLPENPDFRNVSDILQIKLRLGALHASNLVTRALIVPINNLNEISSEQYFFCSLFFLF